MLVLVGLLVTKTMGHISQFTLGLASNGQTPETQLASSWVLSLLHSPYSGEVGTGLPAVPGQENRAACQLFLVKEREAEPAEDCPPGVKTPPKPEGK